MKLFFQYDLEEDWVEPRRSYMGDAGYDLFASRDSMVEPGRVVHVPVNTRVDFPPGWFGLVNERSSQGVNGILTLGNVIDEGYTGGIGVNLLNTTRNSVIIHRGDKVGQLVLIPRFIDPHEHQLELRKAKGYGSSGLRARVEARGFVPAHEVPS
jgi:dUTP pyrophosphatase